MFTEVLLFLLGTLICRLWISTWRPKNFPPGPRGIPILGYLPFLGKKPYIKLCELGDKYGGIYSIDLGSVRTVVLTDFELMKQAMKLDKFNDKPGTMYFHYRSEGRHGVVLSVGSKWDEQRRFAMQQLRDFGFGKSTMESLVQDQLQDLLESFTKDIGTPINISNRFNIAVVNALWQIVAGEKLKHDDPRLAEINKMFSASISNTLGIGSSVFLPFLAEKFPKLVGFNEFEDFISALNKFLLGIVAEHKKVYQETEMKDFIDTYLREIYKTKNPSSSFYEDEGFLNLKIVLQDLFGAGSETTSTTLTWTFLYLACFPEIQKKCQEEIDRVIGHSHLPSNADRPNLPYCEATMQEVFRYSSIVLLGPLHAATADTQFAGYTIPKGTAIYYSQYYAHFDRKTWGDPENFRPERFIADDGTFIKHDNVIPFGLGKRLCLGEPLARTTFMIFFTGLLQRFNFTTVPGEPPSLEPHMGMVLAPKPFKLIAEERRF